MTRDQVVRRSPEILSGTPVFAGTRVPVQNLIDYLAAGDGLVAFLDDFPSVSREQAVAFLGDRAALSQLDTLILYDEDGATHPSPMPVAHCRRIALRDLTDRPAAETDRSSADAGSNMFTTSGTTSRPKFVLHSQGAIVRHARIVADGFGYAKDGAPILQYLPLCGVFGFCMATASLAAGVAMVLMSAFDAEEAFGLIEKHGVGHLNAPDDVIDALLQISPHEIALPTVRYIGYDSSASA